MIRLINKYDLPVYVVDPDSIFYIDGFYREDDPLKRVGCAISVRLPNNSIATETLNMTPDEVHDVISKYIDEATNE